MPFQLNPPTRNSPVAVCADAARTLKSQNLDEATSPTVVARPESRPNARSARAPRSAIGDDPHVSSIPKFIGVHLAVADITSSAEFYRAIGLPVPDNSDLGEHVEVDLGGGTHLALSTERVVRMYDPGWRVPARPPGGALQFQLSPRDAVDRLYEQLVGAGYQGHLAPIDAFWGNRYAEVDDPDGNIVGLHGST